jgi:hypothetical protein
MRPSRFEALLVSAARTAPGVTAARTFGEGGVDRYPFGVEVQAGGRTSRWQVTATSAPGDDYARPEPAPVLGEKPAVLPAGEAGQDPATVEAALIAAVLQADAGEIAAVERYSTRQQPPAVQYGATITCQNGARLYINAVR